MRFDAKRDFHSTILWVFGFKYLFLLSVDLSLTGLTSFMLAITLGLLITPVDLGSLINNLSFGGCPFHYQFFFLSYIYRQCVIGNVSILAISTSSWAWSSAICCFSKSTLLDMSSISIYTKFHCVCAICCNLDSQITPTTEDLQASTSLGGLPRDIEDKAVVKHCGFESYKTKQVKSSINHLPLCPKRAVWLHHCFQELKSLISVSFYN